jgi:hypothetical protein
VKKRYEVPKGSATAVSLRRDDDVGLIFRAQYLRGLFETNIVNMVSRAEAFIQECAALAVCEFPEKIGILSEKAGIPADLLLTYDTKEQILKRFVALRCEALMFGKPSEYMDKIQRVLSIELDADLCAQYIELKASRDIIVHGRGEINRLYVDKAGAQRRGDVGEELEIDLEYFKHVLVTLKDLSKSIQRETESRFG